MCLKLKEQKTERDGEKWRWCWRQSKLKVIIENKIIIYYFINILMILLHKVKYFKISSDWIQMKAMNMW